MIWIQDNPFSKCHKRGIGGTCYDPKCSTECRQRWAKRESWVLISRLMRERRDGRFLFFGTSKVGQDVDPEQLKTIIAAMAKSISQLDAKWRYYVEATPSAPGRVHIHYVVSASTRIDRDMPGLWADAIDAVMSDAGNRASTICRPIQSVAAVAKYISSHTNGKALSPLFSRNLGIKTSGGTRGFIGDVATVHKSLVRSFSASQLAIADADILDHPSEDFYLQLADEHYRQSRDLLSDAAIYDGAILAGLFDEENPVATYNHKISSQEETEDAPDAPLGTPSMPEEKALEATTIASKAFQEPPHAPSDEPIRSNVTEAHEPPSQSPELQEPPEPAGTLSDWQALTAALDALTGDARPVRGTGRGTPHDAT